MCEVKAAPADEARAVRNSKRREALAPAGFAGGSRFSRESRDPLQSLPGAAPHGASSDGPPAPHRLEQPSPCMYRSLTPLVVNAGTASPVPGPAGSWRDACLAAHASR